MAKSNYVAVRNKETGRKTRIKESLAKNLNYMEENSLVLDAPSGDQIREEYHKNQAQLSNKEKAEQMEAQLKAKKAAEAKAKAKEEAEQKLKEDAPESIANNKPNKPE